MRIGSFAAATMFALIMFFAHGMVAVAAELKVISAAAMRPVLNELGPRFERETGHKLVIQYDVIGVLKRQIDAGEKFDVTILTTPLIDELMKQGKIAAGTRTDIGRSGIGVIVRTGAPKPDISSAEAFKRAMLNAKSISYAKEGATAIYLAGLFKRLGIAEQMNSKTKYAPVGRNAEFIAEGQAELGLVVISALDPVQGAELLGPLPAALQSYVRYTGGVGTASKEKEAGRALLKSLRTPAALPVLKAKGMEPITK